MCDQPRAALAQGKSNAKGKESGKEAGKEAGTSSSTTTNKEGVEIDDVTHCPINTDG